MAGLDSLCHHQVLGLGTVNADITTEWPISELGTNSASVTGNSVVAGPETIPVTDNNATGPALASKPGEVTEIARLGDKWLWAPTEVSTVWGSVVEVEAVFTLGRFWEKHIRIYLSVKSYHLGCSFTLIRWKCEMKMTTFKSGNKSVYFNNGTTSHLSFSSCKQQKRLKTSKIRYWHVIFHVSWVKSCPMVTRLPVLLFSAYSFHPFLAERNESV